MDLDEYLWRNKILKKDFAKKIGIQAHSLGAVVSKKVTANLVTAINILKATEGQVDIETLVREEDKKLIIHD